MVILNILGNAVELQSPVILVALLVATELGRAGALLAIPVATTAAVISKKFESSAYGARSRHQPGRHAARTAGAANLQSPRLRDSWFAARSVTTDPWHARPSNLSI
jgi:hypothetical protein